MKANMWVPKGESEDSMVCAIVRYTDEELKANHLTLDQLVEGLKRGIIIATKRASEDS